MRLPQQDREKLVVLIRERPEDTSNSGFGHLETLFAELGIKLICHGSDHIPKLSENALVKIYSNGYEARVYCEKSVDLYYSEDSDFSDDEFLDS